MHDVVVIGVPLFVILAGILLNRSDARELKAEIAGLRVHVDGEIRGLRGHLDAEIGKLRGNIDAEIKSLRSELLGRFNVLEADMRQFYHLTGKLEARVDALEKR